MQELETQFTSIVCPQTTSGSVHSSADQTFPFPVAFSGEAPIHEQEGQWNSFCLVWLPRISVLLFAVPPFGPLPPQTASFLHSVSFAFPGTCFNGNNHFILYLRHLFLKKLIFFISVPLKHLLFLFGLDLFRYFLGF
jgi:hypothetical protein